MDLEEYQRFNSKHSSPNAEALYKGKSQEMYTDYQGQYDEETVSLGDDNEGYVSIISSLTNSKSDPDNTMNKGSLA
jgi:hypothetical protein